MTEELLKAYEAVKKEKEKCERERASILQNKELSEKQREEFLTENHAIMIGINLSLQAIKRCQ